MSELVTSAKEFPAQVDIGFLLAGAWRGNPPDLELSSDALEQLMPLITGSKAVPLVWARIRNSHDHQNETKECPLRKQYRENTSAALAHETALELLVNHFRAENMVPLLIKGWAVSRFYSHSHMRPSGDYDFCFPISDYSKAKQLLSENTAFPAETQDGVDYLLKLGANETGLLPVDLHRDLSKFCLSELAFDRAKTTELGTAQFLTPCPEDQLRIAAIHFLKDGGWRPISLCDVAAIVEAATNEFNWDLCMGDDPVVADWIATAIGLARSFLSADISAVPPEYRKKRVPDWLRKSVENAWEGPFVSPYAGLPFKVVWRRPKSAWKEIRRRWPNPIIATVSLHLPFDDQPRWPIQAKWFATKAVRFMGRLRK